MSDMGVQGGKGTRAGGLVKPQGAKWGAHRLTGLISCLVFVPRLDHPYIVLQECVAMEILPWWGKSRHVLDPPGEGGGVLTLLLGVR